MHQFLDLVLRDTGDDAPTPACATNNDYDGRIGVRISAVFVILLGSTFGALFPVLARRQHPSSFQRGLFFFAKFFGSGVIIATAFVHLLSPANDALRNPCLTGPITDYDWVEGIVLMTIFVLFFVELMAMRYATFADMESELGHSHGIADPVGATPPKEKRKPSYVPGDDHLSHERDHIDHDHDDIGTESTRHKTSDVETADALVAPSSFVPDNYASQITALFVLEFGVIFHSIFIGLTLAVSGSEFNTLYVVLVFHQTFEGLGLGSRIAVTPWPRSKRWTPYIMAMAYGLTTPLAIAIGLGVRNSYTPGSQIALIVNGVFDSISAGILIYTGLVELLAHEFMFSQAMRQASIQRVLLAFGIVTLGAGLMALLGKWA